eukprot:5056028-Amphidinium_carterae.1
MHSTSAKGQGTRQELFLKVRRREAYLAHTSVLVHYHLAVRGCHGCQRDLLYKWCIKQTQFMWM